MRYLLVILMLISSPSCSIIRKTLHKKKEMHNSQVDSVYKFESALEETIDTNVILQEETAAASKPVDNIIAGDTLETETPTLKVKTFYDSKSKNLRTTATKKEQKVPVKVIRKWKFKGEMKVNKKTEDRKEEKQVEKKKRGIGWPGALVILVLICLAWYRLFK